MQTAFNIYGSKTGITYVYVSDDGAANGSPGVVGARGDVRIGGTDLAGPFAYNGSPPWAIGSSTKPRPSSPILPLCG